MFISAENRLKMDTVIDMLYQYVLKDTMPINIDSLFALFDIDIIILPENATEFNKMFNDMFPILRKNKEKGILYI